MIEEILPAAVCSGEAFVDPPDVLLFPEEEALVARAVEKRRREFATGRTCARAALGRLGILPIPIMVGERGMPRWPLGVVGSITHCPGYRAAAVARDRDLAAIGVDAEPNEALPQGVLDAIALARERARLRDLAAADPGICWDRLLFSAKESVYKAWFPLARCWLGFEDADIMIDAENRAFGANLLKSARCARDYLLTGFAGRWLVRDGLIVTTVTVPAASIRELEEELVIDPGAAPSGRPSPG